MLSNKRDAYGWCILKHRPGSAIIISSVSCTLLNPWLCCANGWIRLTLCLLICFIDLSLNWKAKKYIF